MILTDDPLRDFNRWEDEEYLKKLALPICSDCGEPITGDYYWEFHGCYYCEDCVKEHRGYVEDL